MQQKEIIWSINFGTPFFKKNFEKSEKYGKIRLW